MELFDCWQLVLVDWCFAGTEDVEDADPDKVDAAATSLPASTEVGMTAAASQGKWW